MSRQARILDGVKQKSQTTLHNLKKKLQNLEDLVSSNTRSRAELEEELDINHVFQQTAQQDQNIQQKTDRRLKSANRKSELHQYDAYSSKHQEPENQSEKWTSEISQHKLTRDQSDEFSAKGDAYLSHRAGRPVRGILKRSHSSVDDRTVTYRPRRTVSDISDSELDSHHFRERSASEVLSRQREVSFKNTLDCVFELSLTIFTDDVTSRPFFLLFCSRNLFLRV